ncbi:hypothetical protein E3Q08_03229 [Wallemia mellicola]|nr:hypothetical protein E3Q08_03229 [Wallemia mellicola]
MKISEIKLKHSIKGLKAYEKLALRKFDSDDAWFISDKLRSYDYEGSSIVFTVRLFNGLELTSGVIGQVAPHNYDWLNAKYNTVAKYHMSSHLYGQNLIVKHHSIPSWQLSPEDTSRIAAMAVVSDYTNEYFRTLLVEEKGCQVDWNALSDDYSSFISTLEEKASLHFTGDELDGFFKSIFPSSVAKTGPNGCYYIENVRIKDSNEKLKISPTNLMGEKTENNYPEYAAHGGAFPINIKNVLGPIGALSISGLPNGSLDHAVAYNVITELAAHQAQV